MHQDVILGAGVAGLTLAFELVERGRDVVVLEGSKRTGGVIRTLRRDGLVIEQGPQSLQTKPEILSLVGRLGLRSEVVGAQELTAHRYVLHQGELVELPHGPADLFRSPLLSPLDALRALAEPFVRTPAPADETVYDFVARRFGEAVAASLIDPFVAGVFGGDPRELDVATAFADLVRYEREHGSVVRGGIQAARQRTRPAWAPRTMMTFRHGMQTLTDTLTLRLGSRIRLQHRALEVRDTGDSWEVYTPKGVVQARNLWVCVPPDVSNQLFRDAQLHVSAVPVAAVHLLYPKEAVGHPLRGFGWLASSTERRDTLGCLWVSSIFPGHAPGYAMLRVMVGGTRAPHRARLPEDVLIAKAREVLAETQGIDIEPVLTDVSVADPGIPQYPPGFAKAVAAIQDHPRRRFLGWGFTGVGVSHCVRAAAAAAQNAPS